MASDLTEWFNIARRFVQIENTILLGQQEGGSIDGVQERSATASKSNSSENQNQETKDRRTARFIELVEQVRANIEQMKASIKALEESFQKRDGEEWREKLALKILGEDDIPQRRSGESIEAYRERLEILLIDELLNADGSIKGAYKNHPELGDYAQWAQKQYHLKAARGYVRELENPHAAPERHEEILHELKQSSSFEELALTSHEATLKSDVQHTVKEIIDSTTVEQSKEVHSTGTANNFLKPIS